MRDVSIHNQPRLDKRLAERLSRKKTTLDSYRPFRPEIAQRLHEDVRIQLTYHSNALEGNTLNLRETQIVIEEGITIGGHSLREHLKATNHAEAFDYLCTLVETTTPFTIETILTLHALVLKALNPTAGQFRTTPDGIYGSDLALPHSTQVHTMVAQWVAWLRGDGLFYEPVVRAALAYQKFVAIHPFEDGTGRTGRLLLNLLLMRDGYAPALLLRSWAERHRSALRAADQRKYNPIVNLVGQAVEAGLDFYLEACSAPPDERSQPLPELARSTGRDPNYLGLLVRQGKLEAIKRQGRWYSTLAALQLYDQQAQEGIRQRGRPRLHEAAALLSVERTTKPHPADSLRPAHSPATTPPSSSASTPSFPLLTTKISVPPARLHMVPRPRLTQRMHAAIRGPLTLLAAPAGWGKTTLLHAWSADADRGAWPLAWVSLDASDNDPIRFWTYVISALNALHPGVGEIPLAQLYASPPPPIEAVLTPLLNALIQLPTETVLVLDDYHLIETQLIHDALTYLAEHLPPNVHLVIASRNDPLLPLARLRAQGLLTELRAPDLRFTLEETAAFLTEVMGLPLLIEQVTALQVRTEGWIAGLQLAALSLQGRDDVTGFIEAFTGSHRYVVDYLVDEVLLRQPADVQDFLVQTCVLDRLCGPLCDAVRERDDSQARLAYLERSNLFLVALDEERQWYRYHHLFAEVLHTRLRQTHSALVPELHRRACRWFEQHQLFDEAITHALAIPDIERAARLIEQYACIPNFPSKFHTLLGWLNRLPDALIRAHPILCIMQAVTLMILHQLEQASARIQDAERSLEGEMPADQRRTVLCLIAASRGNLARFVGDHERGVPLAQQALELMPEVEETPLIRMARQGTLVTAASTYLVDGEMTPATERFVMATVASVRDLGNLPATLRSISNLARLQLLQGRLRQAASTIEQGRHLASGHEGLQALLNGADYYFILGELLREWNQLERAEQYLQQGMDMDQGAVTAEAEMIMRGYLALARLQQACGWSTRAYQTLDTFARLAQQRGFAPALLARGAAVRAQLALAQGDLAAAIRWSETSGLSATDELSYPREQAYLMLVRVRIAQGRAQPTGPFLSEALGLLERFGEDAEAKSRMRSVLEVLLLRALALQAQGDLTEALAALVEALVLAEPEGFIRLFLDEGAPMVALLRQVQKHTRAPGGYVATLLEASGETTATTLDPLSPRSSPLLEALTGREREVLRLLMDGASNREIAQQLVLSVNTVKKHVLNICGKLGVQSRTQAIVKARTLNLL
jgi:LuxR family maltose regulon positive regulatory protein